MERWRYDVVERLRSESEKMSTGKSLTLPIDQGLWRVVLQGLCGFRLGTNLSCGLY